MLFIHRLPFRNTLPEANDFDADMPWLPITVQQPPSPVQWVPNFQPSGRAAEKPAEPDKSKILWKPTPWLLDTGCNAPGWVHGPDALRPSGVTAEDINDLRIGNEVRRFRVGDNRVVEVFPCRLFMWLRSNLSVLRNYPVLLRTNPGVMVRVPQTAAAARPPGSHPPPKKVFPNVVGMEQLIGMDMEIRIVAGRRLLSVRVPMKEWREANELSRAAASSLCAAATVLWRRHDVWNHGRDWRIYDRR